MKKVIYVLVLPLVVVSGLVFANSEIKKETKPSPRPLTVAEKKAALEAREKWLGTPDGIRFKVWEASPEGKKVRESHYKIRESIKSFSNMEAVVTSVTFTRTDAKSGPKWLIVKIGDDEYMMQFVAKDFQQLKNLQVNDRIILRSRVASYSPNHPHLILSGDYIEHNGKVLHKHDFSKDRGC